MNRSKAIQDIQNIFARYRAAMVGDKAWLLALSDGKLYELFVLSEVLKKLRTRGFQISFVGTVLKFKAGPGMLKLCDPHFELHHPATSTVDWRVFVDIEFITLGSTHTAAKDSSRCHEIDIVVTNATNGYPNYDEIALGVECKSTPKFKKALLKEALGLRRELSYLHGPRPSILSQAGVKSTLVNANPPSEYWLVNPDAKVLNYRQSPATFSIELLHIKP